MAGQIVPGGLPGERGHGRHAGQLAEFTVKTGEGAEVPGVVVRLDGEQPAAPACVTEHLLPLADAGTTVFGNVEQAQRRVLAQGSVQPAEKADAPPARAGSTRSHDISRRTAGATAGLSSTSRATVP